MTYEDTGREADLKIADLDSRLLNTTAEAFEFRTKTEQLEAELAGVQAANAALTTKASIDAATIVELRATIERKNARIATLRERLEGATTPF